MNQIRYTLTALILLMMGFQAGCGSSSGSKNALILTNNADYMAIKYGDGSWKRVEDNSEVSIQLENTTDTASIFYVCSTSASALSQMYQDRINSAVNNQENSIINNKHISIITFNKKHIDSNDSKAIYCETNDYIYEVPNPITVSIAIPSNYSLIDTILNNSRDSARHVRSGAYEIGEATSGDLYHDYYGSGLHYSLNNSTSFLTIKRINYNENNIDIALLVKNDSGNFFQYINSISVNSSQTITLNYQDFQNAEIVESLDTHSSIQPDTPSTNPGYGSSYNYDDGIKGGIWHLQEQPLNLCGLQPDYCWNPYSLSISMNLF